MNTNRIHPADDIQVGIYFEGNKVDTYQGSGYHTVDEAVVNAYDGSDRTPLTINDYVFDVHNLSTGTDGRYRVNAGGHAHLVV